MSLVKTSFPFREFYLVKVFYKVDCPRRLCSFLYFLLVFGLNGWKKLSCRFQTRERGRCVCALLLLPAKRTQTWLGDEREARLSTIINTHAALRSKDGVWYPCQHIAIIITKEVLHSILRNGLAENKYYHRFKIDSFPRTLYLSGRFKLYDVYISYKLCDLCVMENLVACRAQYH